MKIGPEKNAENSNLLPQNSIQVINFKSNGNYKINIILLLKENIFHFVYTGKRIVFKKPQEF